MVIPPSAREHEPATREPTYPDVDAEGGLQGQGQDKWDSDSDSDSDESDDEDDLKC